LYSLASSSKETGIPEEKSIMWYLDLMAQTVEIPKDGDLLRVKASLEDTVVVEPATDDDLS
jgi:hypothetical protein